MGKAFRVRGRQGLPGRTKQFSGSVKRERERKGQTVNLKSFWIFLPLIHDNNKGDIMALNDNKV